MTDLIADLRQKGWTQDDIYKAMSIIKQGEKKKSKKLIFLDSIVYWLILGVALIGNFLIAIIMIPFLLTMQGFSLFFVVSVIGFAFGALFDILIRDIEELEKKDVIIDGIFLPLLAFITVVLMVNFSNFIQETLGLMAFTHNPIGVGIVYSIAFVLPYTIKTAILYKQGRSDFWKRV